MEIKPLFSGRAYYEITANDGQKYVYTPQEFVQKGFVQGKVQNYDPVFMDKKDDVLSKASSFTLPEGLSVNSAASKLYSEPSKGLIWKAEDFAPYSDSGKYYFEQYNINDKSPAITGLATVNGKAVYATNASKGYDSSYLSGSKAGEVEFTNITQGKSGGGFFGGFLGDVVNPVFESVGDVLIENQGLLPLLNLAAPGLGTALAVGTAAGQGDIERAALTAGIGEATGNSMFTEGGGTPIWATTDPNAVGGVTGPDNIDVGGGFNPATGATAAELEAARLALEAPSATGLETLPSSVNTPEQAFGTGGAEVTADQITNEISSGTAPLSSADKSALYSNAGYGDTMTSAQIDAFDKAVASGMTVSKALDYARAGLFVNAIAGDPLGLGGGGAQQGASSGSTGFAQVPIPAEWKSPTYAEPSAPIDLNSIFSNQNMLGGTQWQGLPTQQPNVSFNDIFAAGQQQTPMGSPVDINQIVSAILGQAATSQKPA